MPHVSLTPPPIPPTIFDDFLCLPKAHGGGPITTIEQWALKRADIHQRFLSILGEFPATRPPAEPRTLEETRCEHYTRRRITYAVEHDEEAEAWLLIPHRKSPHPAVLCLHGTRPDFKDQFVGLNLGPTNFSSQNLSHDLAVRGFVTLTPDHFCTGKRVPPEGHYHTDALYRRHPRWSAVGKALWDESAAIDVLSALPEVDPARIGCMGHSLGGHGTLFFAAYDPRIAVAVCCGGAVPWRADSERMHWARDYWYRYFPLLREGFLSGRVGTSDGVIVDMVEVATLIAPRPFLDLSALNDDNFGRECGTYLMDAWLRVGDVYALHKAAGNFAYLAHRLGHGLPDFARACAITWLERHLCRAGGEA